MKPWERQQNESDKAFAAFRCYLDQDVHRSTAKVAQALGKSKALIDRWSSRHGWVARVLSYTDFLNETSIKAREQETAKIARKIISADEVKLGLSTIADADIAEVFEEDGTFDLALAKRRGKSRLIKSISFDKDTGKVAKIEMYSAHEGMRDMGKIHKLFVDKVETTDTSIAAFIHLRIEIASLAEDQNKPESEIATFLLNRASDKSKKTYNREYHEAILGVVKENWPDLLEKPKEIGGIQ